MKIFGFTDKSVEGTFGLDKFCNLYTYVKGQADKDGKYLWALYRQNAEFLIM